MFVEKILFRLILWKYCPNIFYPWLSNVPYIGGKWVGELQSDYIYPETKKIGPPIAATMEINHEFDKVSVRLDTGQSFSSSYVSDVWIDGSNRKYLCYVYYNDADKNRDSNPNHDGVTKLRIIDDGELRLEGHYFTGRKTMGEMTFKMESRKNSHV